MSATAQKLMMDRSIEAEQALLGAVLLNSAVLDALDGMVKPEDFSEGLHEKLFASMLDAHAEGRRFDAKLFCSLIGKEWTDRVDGSETTIGQYIARMAAECASIINARDYGRLVVENAGYRRLSELAQILSEKSFAAHAAGRPSKIAAEIIADLDTIVASSLSTGVRRVTAGEAGKMALDAMYEQKKNQGKIDLPWPVADLNKATLGLHGGELTIVAARPSMGKTTFGLGVAVGLAKAGKSVLFFSLEMGAQSLGERVLSDLAYDWGDPVPYVDIRAASISDSAADRLGGAYDAMCKLPLYIEQQSGVSVSQISARTRALHQASVERSEPLSCIVVDHLGLIAPSGRYAGARHSELGEITSALKGLAKELNIPVVLLSQLNRGVESRENKRPGMQDLRESGRIEEDADTVMFLYREAYYLERTKEAEAEKELLRHQRLMEVQNILEINIAKQRQGPTRTVECFVAMPCNAIRNLDRRQW